MDSLIQDLRFAARSLARSPGFTAVALVTLALGIGANATIFSAVDALLFRAPLLREPERIVMLWATNTERGAGRQIVSLPEFQEWRRRSRSFERLAAFVGVDFDLGKGEPLPVYANRVSADFFPLLGIAPARGRVFTGEEEGPGADRVVVLSHGLWKRAFGGNPGILGREVRLDGRAHTVIGVMPRDFRPQDSELWTPLTEEAAPPDWSRRSIVVLGRLRAGVSLAQARAEMSTLSAQLGSEHPQTNAGWTVNAVPLPEEARRDSTSVMRLLLGSVLLVLLIGCANLANLLLARGSARQREIAVRAALGAGRWRLLRLLLTESLLLSIAGAALGLLLSSWWTDFIRHRFAAPMPSLHDLGVDPRVVGFTLLLSLLSAAVFGAIPALLASRVDLNGSLRGSGRSVSGGVRGRRTRGALVVAEFALALVLLVAAGLMMRTMAAFLRIEPGFDPRNLLTMRVALPDRYAPEAVPRFFAGALGRIELLPGVTAAGAASRIPTAGSRLNPNRTLALEGQPAPEGRDEPWVVDLTVSPRYFRTMGIPLRAGRALGEEDSAEAPPVALVSETMARRGWPGQEALGRRFRLGDAGRPWITVVGVVGDVRNDDIDAPPLAQVYLPLAQNPQREMSVVVRTAGTPLGLAAAVRESVRAQDPDPAVADLKTMDQMLFEDLAGPYLIVGLIGAFAALALVLAAVGVYGVVAYTVGQRTHEFGIRLALGARRRDVLAAALGQSMKMALAGLVLGLAGALALTRVLAGLLYGVGPRDPVTLAIAVFALAAAALLAGYVPARRATGVDPAVALRYE